MPGDHLPAVEVFMIEQLSTIRRGARHERGSEEENSEASHEATIIAPLFVSHKTRRTIRLLFAALLSGDQAGSAVIRKVAESPPNEHDDPVLEIDQVHQVDEQPDAPRDNSAQAQSCDLRHRRF